MWGRATGSAYQCVLVVFVLEISITDIVVAVTLARHSACSLFLVLVLVAFEVFRWTLQARTETYVTRGRMSQVATHRRHLEVFTCSLQLRRALVIAKVPPTRISSELG